MSTNRALSFMVILSRILRAKFKFVSFPKYSPTIVPTSTTMPVISAKKICSPKTRQTTYQKKALPE
jgi:hypothetical protein